MSMADSWTSFSCSHKTFESYLGAYCDYADREHYREGHCCIGFLEHDLVELLKDLLNGRPHSFDHPARI
jgi:hypothetical protein